MPGGDDKHVPCICSIDFKIRNNKLNTTAFFRSQDIGKKVYADMISLTKIASLIADSVKADVGFLVLHIASAHIYESDMKRVNSLVV